MDSDPGLADVRGCRSTQNKRQETKQTLGTGTLKVNKTSFKSDAGTPSAGKTRARKPPQWRLPSVAAQAPPSLSGKAQRVHGGRQWRASQVLLHFEAGVTTLSFAWWPP